MMHSLFRRLRREWPLMLVLLLLRRRKRLHVSNEVFHTIESAMATQHVALTSSNC